MVFEVHLQMDNSHLKIKVKTKVSGVEMFLILLSQRTDGLEGAQLGHGGTNGKSERGVAPLFVSAGVH